MVGGTYMTNNDTKNINNDIINIPIAIPIAIFLVFLVNSAVIICITSLLRSDKYISSFYIYYNLHIPKALFHLLFLVGWHVVIKPLILPPK